MKNHRNITKLAAFFMVCMMIVCAFSFVGGTNAFYTGTASRENKIGVQKVEIDVEEEVSGLTKKSVTIKNPQGASCYVRLKVSIPVIQGLESFDPVYGEFKKGDDGFYYLPRVLLPEESVTLGSDSAPFYSAWFEEKLSPEEKERIASLADVVIYVEAVQADGIGLSDGTESNSLDAAMYAFSLINGV